MVEELLLGIVGPLEDLRRDGLIVDTKSDGDCERGKSCSERDEGTIKGRMAWLEGAAFRSCDASPGGTTTVFSENAFRLWRCRRRNITASATRSNAMPPRTPPTIAPTGALMPEDPESILVEFGKPKGMYVM